MQKEKIVITIETRRKTIVHKKRRLILTRCEICGTDVQMYSPAEAAGICGISLWEIYRRIEHGDLHFTETPDGALLICDRALSGN